MVSWKRKVLLADAALLGHYDGCTCILAERQFLVLGHVGVEQHGQGHGLVVAAGLGVIENLGHHLVVLGTEHEGHIVESLAGYQPESLGIDFQNFQNFLALELSGRHIVLGDKMILGSILTHLEKFLVFEFHICCYLFVS